MPKPAVQPLGYHDRLYPPHQPAVRFLLEADGGVLEVATPQCNHPTILSDSTLSGYGLKGVERIKTNEGLPAA